MIDLTSIKILIVDDEPELVDIMSQMLEMRGAQTFQASNGVQAFEVWTSNPTIDVVITDVTMPGQGADGITLVRKIREVSPIAPPIIMITGYSNQTRAEAIAAGAAEVFPKPFRIEDLDEALGKLLKIK
jgi:CheY-like chemotaxis protein